MRILFDTVAGFGDGLGQAADQAKPRLLRISGGASSRFRSDAGTGCRAAPVPLRPLGAGCAGSERCR